MVRVEKIGNAFCVVIGGEVITCKEVLVDDAYLHDIDEYANADTIFIEASEAKKAGDAVYIYTLLWLLDTALSKHAKYLLGGLKISLGGRNG